MTSTSDALARPVTVRARIVQAARERLISHGYGRLTMDELAAELGVSKKTLYRHFASKEALARQVIMDLGQEVRAHADGILDNSRLSFAQKLQDFITGMVQRLTQMSPRLLQDLQRFAPELHELILSMRRRNIPDIFGRLLTEGQERGMVRQDLDPGFAAEFLLHAMQGLMQPVALDHLRLGPQEVFEKAMNIFFGGLLTPAGRKDYEKFLAR
jgi:AcrR family transcriptional regulator